MNSTDKKTVSRLEQVGHYTALSEADARRVETEFKIAGMTTDVCPALDPQAFNAKWHVSAFKEKKN
jgi:hypothetical protein